MSRRRATAPPLHVRMVPAERHDPTMHARLVAVLAALADEPDEPEAPGTDEAPDEPEPGASPPPVVKP